MDYKHHNQYISSTENFKYFFDSMSLGINLHIILLIFLSMVIIFVFDNSNLLTHKFKKLIKVEKCSLKIHLQQFKIYLEKFLMTQSLIITNKTSAVDIANWDSLNHVVLIIEVEKVFKIKFALGELQDLKNVGSLVEIIDKKVN